jgi:flagellar hook assembly protein FlgD
MPKRVALYPSCPNPCGPADRGAQIRFDLPQAAAVRLQVFDATGRLVRGLLAGDLPGGEHAVDWDGRDVRSRPVGSGVYYYVLTTGGQRTARPVLVVR